MNIIEKFLSPISYEIWKMLDYPEDWRFDPTDTNEKYRIIHKETGISLWIANGRWFLNGSKMHREKSLTPDIEVFERHILWYKVSKVIQYLKKNESEILPILKEFNKKRNNNEQ